MVRVLALAALVSWSAAAAPQDLERAKQIVAGKCFLCHGMQGEAASELSPRLAAQNPGYIAKQLANFKSGERRSSAMRAMVADLSPQDMKALGAYFSRQPAARHPAEDKALAARGRAIYERGGGATEVAACIGCHGERGHGTQALPRLAGQVPSYLVAQLKGFGSRERTNDNATMHTIAARMTDEEMRAVAEYLGDMD